MEYFTQFFTPADEPTKNVVSLGILHGPMVNDKNIQYKLSKKYILRKNNLSEYQRPNNYKVYNDTVTILEALEKKCGANKYVYKGMLTLYEIRLPNNIIFIWSDLMTSKVLFAEDAYLEPNIVDFIKSINIDKVIVPSFVSWDNEELYPLFFSKSSYTYGDIYDQDFPLSVCENVNPYVPVHMLLTPVSPSSITKLSSRYYTLPNLKYADIIFGIALTPELAQNIEEVYFRINGLCYQAPMKEVRKSPHGLPYFPISSKPIPTISCQYANISTVIKFINEVQELPEIYLYVKNFYEAMHIRKALVTNVVITEPYIFSGGMVGVRHDKNHEPYKIEINLKK